MANPYRELFNAPGARAFVIAAMIARMPISMTGIGVITMLSQLTGGYALAGGVAATFALATAFCAPQVSRLVDRFGQGRVLADKCLQCLGFARQAELLAQGVEVVSGAFHDASFAVRGAGSGSECNPDLEAGVINIDLPARAQALI